MAINFNHAIVWSRDSKASTTFLAEVLGLPAPRRWGAFLVVTTDNGANVDFMNADGDIALQYYAFLVSESRVRRNFWSGSRTVASPSDRATSRGRGFYFEDPTGTS